MKKNLGLAEAVALKNEAEEYLLGAEQEGGVSVVILGEKLSSSLMGSSILAALRRLITVTNCGGATSVMNLAMRTLAMAGVWSLGLRKKLKIDRKIYEWVGMMDVQ